MRVKQFVAGALCALLLAGGWLSSPVGAQQIMRIYGTVSGTPIALLANSSGVLRVSLDGGSIPASTCAAPALSLSGGATTGIAFTATPSIINCISGVGVLTTTSTAVTVASGVTLGWSDAILSRLGANNIGMVNGTATQIFSVGPSASTLNIFKANGDVGAVYTVDATALRLGTNNSDKWQIASGGDLTPLGAYNIGDGSGNSPVNGWFENNLTVGANLILDGTLSNTAAGPITTDRAFKSSVSFGSALTTGTLVTNDAQAVADTAVISLGTSTVIGVITVINTSNSEWAMFALPGGGATVKIAGDAIFTATAGTPASVNVYWDAGDARYELQNLRGNSAGFQIIRLGS